MRNNRIQPDRICSELTQYKKNLDFYVFTVQSDVPLRIGSRTTPYLFYFSKQYVSVMKKKTKTNLNR